MPALESAPLQGHGLRRGLRGARVENLSGESLSGTRAKPCEVCEVGTVLVRRRNRKESRGAWGWCRGRQEGQERETDRAGSGRASQAAMSLDFYFKGDKKSLEGVKQRNERIQFTF